MTDKKNINDLKVHELKVKNSEKLADYWINLTNEDAFRIGIDKDEIPTKFTIVEMLKQQIGLPNSEKNTYILIWELDGTPVGHCNITPIITGNSANLHLHIWDEEFRKTGYGEKFARLSIPIFIELYNLNKIYGIFHVHNQAAEKLFQKLGFVSEEEYETIPGDWSFYQTVKKYVLNKEDFESLI